MTQELRTEPLKEALWFLRQRNVRGISAREREVVRLLSQGMRNKEVGSALGISEKTVETHRKNVMNKLNLDSFAELVRYAVRNDLITA